MSWLNFNDSLSSIKGQLSNFASGVLADGVTDDADDASRKRIEDLEGLVSKQISEIETLRKQNQELQEKSSVKRQSLNGSDTEKRDDWFWDPYGGADQEEEGSADPSAAELRRKVRDLENEKKELLASLEQLDLDCQQTTEKIINLKDALQTDHDALRANYAELLRQNEKSSGDLRASHDEKAALLKDLEDLREETENRNRNLREQLDEIRAGEELLKREVDDLKVTLESRDSQIKQQERARETNQEEYRKLASILQGYEEQVTAHKNQCQRAKQENDALKEEKNTQHGRYVSLITESFKKFMDFDLVVDGKDVTDSEFVAIVEAILKLLLELKWKVETLTNEVDDLTEEKTKILTEKNREIEKLISNSELLGREEIAKRQALKHYEAECAELIKNNDLLIVELETYKNNSGLQTISESNEDNLLLLEAQLENANKRVRALESDLENAKQEANVEMQSELDYIKKQLNLTGTELSQAKLEHQQLETEHLDLQNIVAALRKEKQHLDVKVDKIQAEFENTEYKYSEINVDLESLKEENDVLKAEIDDLSKAKANFDCKGELMRNEIDDLKRQLTAEIDAKRSLEVQVRNLSEKLQNAKMAETSLRLQNDTLLRERRCLAEAKENLDVEHDRLRKDAAVASEENDRLREKLALLGEDSEAKAINEKLEERLAELTHVERQNEEYVRKLQAMEAHVDDLNKSRNELIDFVTAKHQESIEYHAEIQRLNQVLTAENEKAKSYEEHLKNATAHFEELAKKNEEVDGLTDQNNFLREKCRLLAQNLLQEQATLQRVLSEKGNASSERETSLSKELERLRGHLLEIEETHTKELLSAETRNQEMQAKVNEIEQREKDSSTLYTSVNIRTNQQVETLQNQLQLVTNQRDELRKKASDAEDQIGKQAAALSNLQFVLEQFQKDKEKDVYHETERIRRQISGEKKVQQELLGEITNLKAQLEESKQGLLAASRLTEQLEGSKQQLTSMKEEVSKLQQKLTRSEERYDGLMSHTDAKVDKLLIKNLVIGFVSANPNFNRDQHQVLRLIANVLDFNQEENEKVHLNKAQGSWLSSILHPGTDRNSESLSQAFVRFLENESKPRRQLPSLLESTGTHATPNNKSGGEISGTSSRQSPILLSEVVLPTFVDFGQNRNSSSILKDALKNNSS